MANATAAAIVKVVTIKKLNVMKEYILKLKEIMCGSDGERAIKPLICLVEKLGEVACAYNPNLTKGLFEDFFNFDTLNYVSDERMSEIKLEKWDKMTILKWLDENDLESSKEGVFNTNALCVALNYEFSTHKNYLNTLQPEDVPMAAYLLALGALEKENYIANM